MNTESLIDYIFRYKRRPDLPGLITKIVKENPAAIYERDSWGITPLHYAALFGLLDIMDILLAAGAPVNARDNAGATTLNRAIRNAEHSLDVIKKLLQHKADPNLADNGGSTPLFSSGWDIMEEDACLEKTRLLIAYGASVNVRDKNNYVPLHFMLSEKPARFLLSQGAEIDVRANDGITPLMYAIDNAAPEVPLLLIEHGADIHLRDANGQTPLQHAVSDPDYFLDREDNHKVLKRLLELGVDVNATDALQRTPLHLAVGSHYPTAVKWLLAAGADKTARDDQGRIPLDYALLGIFTGKDPDYAPYPLGEGDPIFFNENRMLLIELLQKPSA